MSLSKTLFRERTQASVKQTITFNASGIYYPPYGKTTFLLQGQGTPGNPNSGGTYASTNPPTGGNYASTNPPTGHNYAYKNPSTGHNVKANSTANYAPGNAYWSQFISYWSGSWGYGTSYGTTSGSYAIPASYSGFLTGSDIYYVNYATISTNPPVVTGYNPTYYNPTVPGNIVYNPTVPGTANYNPIVPGTANYNPYVPGNIGATTSVLGITLPGGVVGTAAPVVGYAQISIDYSVAGIPVSVPTGGYVKIQNV